MKGTAESGAHSDTAPVQNPAAVYLGSLHRSGRRSMRRELDGAVAIFTDGGVTDATAYDWSQIDQQHVEKLRSFMGDRGAAVGTIKHTLSGIRSTVRIAWKLGIVDATTRIAIEDAPNGNLQPSRQPTRYEKPRRRRRAARCVTASEVRHLFGALSTDPIGVRDAAMLTLLYGAGLLPSEAVALQLADYDQDTGVIAVRRDGATKRRVIATNGGKAALDSWLEVRGYHQGALLEPVDKGGSVGHRAITDQAVMNRVRTIVEQARLTSLTANDLRRTYATEQERRQLVARKKGSDIEPLVPEMLPVPYREPPVPRP